MIEIERNVYLKEHNSFGLDVFAANYVCIRNQHDLNELLESDVFGDSKKLVLGEGSNVLFINDYFEGLVIHIATKGIRIAENGHDRVIVEVAAGENWSAFVDQMVSQGYGGVENLSLIPGSVGAAPVQNIGAYGVELKDSFVSLKVFDLETGKIESLGPQDCEFGYRTSVFKTTPLKERYIILSVKFRLSKRPKLKLDYGAVRQQLEISGISNPGIGDVSAAIKQIRQSKLPDPKVLGNAGSFFKNPVVHSLVYAQLKKEHPNLVANPDENGMYKIAAGWLIEQTGCKGKRVDHVGMHENQALVLVNYGGASGSELFHHAMKVQYAVKEKFGLQLDLEVNIIS